MQRHEHESIVFCLSVVLHSHTLFTLFTVLSISSSHAVCSSIIVIEPLCLCVILAFMHASTNFQGEQCVVCVYDPQ